jgi:hypothetical protein
MTDHARITGALLELAACTGGKFDEARIVAYLKRLSDHPLEAVLTSIDRLSRSARFFPSVGEILDGIEGGNTLAAAEAWAKLNRSDPATNETMRLLGGWNRYGQTLETHLHFLERRFLELYPLVVAKMASCAALEQPDPVRYIDMAGGKVVPVASLAGRK